MQRRERQQKGARQSGRPPPNLAAETISHKYCEKSRHQRHRPSYIEKGAPIGLVDTKKVGQRRKLAQNPPTNVVPRLSHKNQITVQGRMSQVVRTRASRISERVLQ